MAAVDNKHRTEAQEWCFRLMNDLIAEFQKLYDKTPATQRYVRARILRGMKQSETPPPLPPVDPTI
jgi:hypothetical protein